VPSPMIDDLTRLFDRAMETAGRLRAVPATEAQSRGGNPTLLMGCGHLGKTTRARLQGAGVEVAAFVDNDPRKWGTACLGRPVLSLQMAVERYGPDLTLVNCVYTGRALEGDLRRRGFNVIPFAALASAYPDALMPHGSLDHPGKLASHRERVLEAAGVWADDASRAEYLAQIRFRATLDGPMPPFLDPATTYFPEDVVELKPDEVFVDCGAFDGDSLRAFLRRSGGWFGGAVAIEADPDNAARLRAFVDGLPRPYAGRIRVVEAAVGAQAGTIAFQVTGTAESTYVGSTHGRLVEVPCRPLDQILTDTPPSYVKMDIEGAEPLAVAGAAATIRRHTPVLAVCLYHDFAHLWEIPLQLRALSDRYAFFLRRYSDDVWEQILYAVPNERVRR
jgi:FkbM family methyltransferase